MHYESYEDMTRGRSKYVAVKKNSYYQENDEIGKWKREVGFQDKWLI